MPIFWRKPARNQALIVTVVTALLAAAAAMAAAVAAAAAAAAAGAAAPGRQNPEDMRVSWQERSKCASVRVS